MTLALSLPPSPWLRPGMVGVAGPSSSGTRMMYDVVRFGLGMEAQHLSLPGYLNRPEGGLDKSNPIWWTPEQTAGDNPVKWVVITRDPYHTALSAIRRGFVPDIESHKAYRQRAIDTLELIEEAYRLTYEDFVVRPQYHVDALAEYLGARSYTISGIYDGNAKNPPPPEPTPEPTPEPAPEPVRRHRRKR